MTREELVPHIAKAIRPKWIGVQETLIADIADIVLEEAVKVADEWINDSLERREVVSAIRALKG